MTNYTSRLYQILYPNSALIASQLSAKDFAKHYQRRSTPQDMGKLIFAKIDTSFRNDYFQIEEALAEMKPHEDGSRKRTKFISSYRVLEHMDLDAIQNLYLANPDGSCLKLDRGKHDKTPREGVLRVLAEICPLSMLVLTKHNTQEFGKIITHRDYAKGCPKLFFTMLNIDLPAFLKEFEENPLCAAPLPHLHPSVLRDAVNELNPLQTEDHEGSLPDEFVG